MDYKKVLRLHFVNRLTCREIANVNHFFTLLGKTFFTYLGKHFFTLPGKQIFYIPVSLCGYRSGCFSR